MAIANVLTAGGAFDYYESEGLRPAPLGVVVCGFSVWVVVIPRVKKAYKIVGGQIFRRTDL